MGCNFCDMFIDTTRGGSSEYRHSLRWRRKEPTRDLRDSPSDATCMGYRKSIEEIEVKSESELESLEFEFARP